MKKLLLFAFLFVSINSFSQDSLRADSLQMKPVGSHIAFSTIKRLKNVTKAEGDSAYIKNDYASAIQVYESILKRGEAVEIYYNLGNSYYKSGNIAKSILNYERALLLQPGNADVRANLEVAQSKTVDKVAEIPEIFFVSWIKALVNSFSLDTWAKIGIGCWWFLLISLYFFFFSRQAKWEKSGFVLGIFFLVLVVLTNLFAFQQKRRLTQHSNAIVLVPSVTVRSTPSENGTSLFLLHEGRKVKIKDGSMSKWKEISLEDGKVGWVPVSSIEVI
ncbi:MAG: tetratricopeptide repeat protein [Bacteroides sp.]|jgi:tetratricopeptide (TPR) repeat protein|nr:tetratricopeptide repeat protein [Bacteroides sp.]